MLGVEKVGGSSVILVIKLVIIWKFTYYLGSACAFIKGILNDGDWKVLSLPYWDPES